MCQVAYKFAMILCLLMAPLLGNTAPVNASIDDSLAQEEEESQLMYQLISAEIALKEKYTTTAFNVYVKMAKKLQNASLAKRALEIALSHGLLMKASAATRLWSYLSPNNWDAQAISVILDLKSHHASAALPTLEKLMQLPPEEAKTLIRMVNQLKTSEEREELQTMLRYLVQHYPKASNIYFMQAYLYKKEKRWEDSLSAMHQALLLSPEWPQAMALYSEIVDKSR